MELVHQIFLEITPRSLKKAKDVLVVYVEGSQVENR